ncbi:unnamed protein product [Cercospora beticola]|nr:unnamed protein product [Cercospora beticola]
MGTTDHPVLHTFVPTALAFPSSQEKGKFYQIGDPYFKKDRTFTICPLLDSAGNNPSLEISVLTKGSGKTIAVEGSVRLRDCAEVKVITGSLSQGKPTMATSEFWAGKATLPHETAEKGKFYDYVSISLKGVPAMDLKAQVIGEEVSQDSIALMLENPRRIVQQLSSQANDLEMITTWSDGEVYDRLQAFVNACGRIPSRLPSQKIASSPPRGSGPFSRGPAGRGRGGHMSDTSRKRPVAQFGERSTDDHSKVEFSISYSTNGTAKQCFLFDREKLSKSSKHYRSVLFNAEKDTSASKQIAVSNVDPWIFSTFHSYVEKDLVELGVWKHEIPGQTIPSRTDASHWSWSLVDCYIFAESCSAPGYRQRILELMQTKFYQKHPVIAKFPPTLVLAKVYSKTQQDSPIRRLLVYMRLDMPALATREKTVEFNASCPNHFLAEITMILERRAAAANCGACFVDMKSSGQKTCTSTSHSLQDWKDNASNDWCLCHEHENDKDKEACQKRREANEWRFADSIICD